MQLRNLFLVLCSSCLLVPFLPSEAFSPVHGLSILARHAVTARYWSSVLGSRRQHLGLRKCACSLMLDSEGRFEAEVNAERFEEVREDLGSNVRARLSPWREAEAVLRAPKDLFKVFRTKQASSSESQLQDLGRSARSILDEHLAKDGAVLLRGLPARSAEQFSIFWDACVTGKEAAAWHKMQYEPFGDHRLQQAGVDLATNTPPTQFLAPHNEMSYNPRPNDVIALYCVQDAEDGGESILCWNRDYVKSVPAALQRFVVEHGGVMYERRYHDARRERPPLSFVSWQDRCKLPLEEGRAAAEEYWRRIGFEGRHILWGEHDELTVRNIERGYVADRSTGEALWYNTISVYSETSRATVMNLSVRMGDGTAIPFSLVEELKRKVLDHSYAVKLRPGDWLVLDNLQVQHGRTPYVNGAVPRTVLTVYASFPP